jgi:urease accessory protein
MPDCTHLHRPDASWHASLRLRFGHDGTGTRLLERTHAGPLRVQKALYPEGAQICHAIVIHPPGGVVGGDSLSIHAQAGPASHALLTSPGAAKWYRANGKLSQQTIRLEAASGAAIEWLPQESIFYNDAQVRLEHDIILADDASYIGCDMLCFGRSASGEHFRSGAISQHTRIRRGGKLLWWEQGTLHGGSSHMESVFGLRGASVCATLIGVGKPVPPALLASMRALDPELGISQIKSVLVARYLGHDSETARRAMLGVWQALRPFLLGCAATVPRIWNT